jgi:hypothetical protein
MIPEIPAELKNSLRLIEYLSLSLIPGIKKFQDGLLSRYHSGYSFIEIFES